MQIRKTYKEINPELLYGEVKDFVLKQGVILDEAKPETYSSPGDSSSFIFRGTLTFKVKDKSGKTGKECLRAHVIGSTKVGTKVMFDVNEELFSKEKLSSLQDDLHFIFGAYELKRR